MHILVDIHLSTQKHFQKLTRYICSMNINGQACEDTKILPKTWLDTQRKYFKKWTKYTYAINIDGHILVYWTKMDQIHPRNEYIWTFMWKQKLSKKHFALYIIEGTRRLKWPSQVWLWWHVNQLADTYVFNQICYPLMASYINFI